MVSDCVIYVLMAADHYSAPNQCLGYRTENADGLNMNVGLDMQSGVRLQFCKVQAGEKIFEIFLQSTGK